MVLKPSTESRGETPGGVRPCARCSHCGYLLQQGQDCPECGLAWAQAARPALSERRQMLVAGMAGLAALVLGGGFGALAIAVGTSLPHKGDMDYALPVWGLTLGVLLLLTGIGGAITGRRTGPRWYWRKVFLCCPTTPLLVILAPVGLATGGGKIGELTVLLALTIVLAGAAALGMRLGVRGRGGGNVA